MADEVVQEEVTQELLDEVDTGHHEHQEENNLQIGFNLMVDGGGIRHPGEDRLDGQDASGNQRIALQRHGQCENKLAHQTPAR